MDNIILTTKQVQERCEHTKVRITKMSHRLLVCENCLKLFDRYGKYRYRKNSDKKGG